ncbi:PREDICTED: uncharacterized protein LOC106807254 [Priapulus caudatus]|uniref:Uncharacterized protein LOC106807254 n=1 Tax=Priapulus caudatus TaxID=37621 RepID=A0ABM1DYL2_PRICU|nr:PREDICTED: uncharacterized protein LOC106807254 [Priapulus caudatus]
MDREECKGLVNTQQASLYFEPEAKACQLTLTPTGKRVSHTRICSCANPTGTLSRGDVAGWPGVRNTLLHRETEEIEESLLSIYVRGILPNTSFDLHGVDTTQTYICSATGSPQTKGTSLIFHCLVSKLSANTLALVVEIRINLMETRLAILKPLTSTSGLLCLFDHGCRLDSNGQLFMCSHQEEPTSTGATASIECSTMPADKDSAGNIGNKLRRFPLVAIEPWYIAPEGASLGCNLSIRLKQLAQNTGRRHTFRNLAENYRRSLIPPVQTFVNCQI